MKKYFVFLFIFISIISCVARDPLGVNLLKDIKDIDEIKKVDMTNSKEKMNYLIHKLSIEKKYYIHDQEEFIKYIIIGTWHNPPHVVYEFKKDNTYRMKIYSTGELIRGNWKVKSNGLELFSNGKKSSLLMKYFSLYYDKENNRYNIEISFDDPSFILSVDTDLAKIWEKEPPIK